MCIRILLFISTCSLVHLVIRRVRVRTVWWARICTFTIVTFYCSAIFIAKIIKMRTTFEQFAKICRRQYIETEINRKSNRKINKIKISKILWKKKITWIQNSEMRKKHFKCIHNCYIHSSTIAQTYRYICGQSLSRHWCRSKWPYYEAAVNWRVLYYCKWRKTGEPELWQHALKYKTILCFLMLSDTVSGIGTFEVAYK